MGRVDSKLIVQRMPWHANMTEMNHLGKALLIKPHIFAKHMTKLFTAERYAENPLTTLLTKLGRTETIGETEWEWPLRGASTRPLVVMENVEPSGITQLGLGRNEFRLKLDQNWWKAGDVIHPGASSGKYQCRIQQAPYKQGNGYIYVVRLMDDAFSAFLPLKYVTVGQQWAKLFSQYGEASKQSGSTQYSLPITLRNRMSRYRKMYEVTGDVHNEVLSVAIPDSKGQMHTTWIGMNEVEYWEQWFREKEIGLWYSKTTNTVLDENGRPILSGAGVHEQLEDSHRQSYNILTAKFIEEYLMDIFYGRVKPGKSRRIEGFSGEYGMIQFHRAVMEWAENRKGFIQMVQMIEKTKSEYNENALAAGYQYVEYRMANGAVLTLTHNPLYDDRDLHFEIDPITGFPTESQRITFLDLAGQGTQSNMKIVKKKNGFKLGYINGLTTPYGNVNDGPMAHSGDYYEMHVQDQEGIQIDDVTRCGELFLDRN